MLGAGSPIKNGTTRARVSRYSYTTRDFCFAERLDEFCRERGNECIAVTAQASHAPGYPMSQRACAGFNRPPLAIPAEEPVTISPDAVRRAGPSHVGHLAVIPDASTSGLIIPAVNSAHCSSPGGLEFPPPDRLPLSVDGVIAFADLRSVEAMGVARPDPMRA